jgi:hypothetical protein
MLKFLGKALASLVLTKDAQKAVGQIQADVVVARAKRRPKSPFDQPEATGGADPAAARQQAIAAVQEGAQALVTPDRAELIRQAMQVRAAKQTILSNLDDETRGKLVATAMKALLKNGGDGA